MVSIPPIGLRDSGRRVPGGPAGGARSEGQTQDRAVDREPGRGIYCRFCLQGITTAAERVSQSGAHRHTFANPHGMVFEIGCFRRAPGCRTQGEATREFSWFSGYAWRLALCGRCLNHLGWRFQDRSDSFFGLIINHLIEIEPDPPPS